MSLALQANYPDGLSGYEVQLALRENYIETHGIMDLDSTAHPWPIIADGPVDGLRDLWGIEQRLAQFELYEIYKHYGYNFTQFTELPRHIVLTIINNRREAEAKIREARAKAEKDLKDQEQRSKNPDISTVPMHHLFRGQNR